MSDRLAENIEAGVVAASELLHGGPGDDHSAAVLLEHVTALAENPEAVINALLLEVAELRHPPLPLGVSPAELLERNREVLEQALSRARAIVATINRGGPTTGSRSPMEALVMYILGLEPRDRSQLVVNGVLAAAQLERHLRDYQAMNSRLNRRGGK